MAAAHANVGYVVSSSTGGVDTRQAHKSHCSQFLTFEHDLGCVDVSFTDKGLLGDSTRRVGNFVVLQSLEEPDATIPCHIDFFFISSMSHRYKTKDGVLEY